MYRQPDLDDGGHWSGPEPAGAAQRVYLGIMRDIEERRMVPGQRLIETELATRFGVGRNAVREAMQHLAVRGVISLSRHRSAAIRQFDVDETLEVLDVAAAMTCLAARAAARNFAPERYAALLDGAMAEVAAAGENHEPGAFSRARRHFYRALLAIGGNRELQRLFPMIGMHIIYSQYQSPRIQEVRLADYAAIRDAVAARDPDTAEAAGRAHVERVRRIILAMNSATSADQRR